MNRLSYFDMLSLFYVKMHEHCARFVITRSDGFFVVDNSDIVIIMWIHFYLDRNNNNIIASYLVSSNFPTSLSLAYICLRRRMLMNA